MRDEGRLYALDAARGFAALAVVAFHFIHFYWIDGRPADFDRSVAPLYPLLRPIYEHGAIGVAFFFCLSGFVFFWLYGEAVRDRTVSAGRFAIMRASRLYPLHIATLIAVAAMQPVFAVAAGHPFIYPENDAWHFGLNLVFLQSVGLEKGYSFNAPSWSVSVEVMLYLLFFALARLRLAGNPVVPAALALAGFAVWRLVYPPIGEGLAGFFLGGLAYMAYAAIIERPDARRIALAALIACLLGWALLLVEGYGLGVWIAPDLAAMFLVAGPLPFTVLALALSERMLRLDLKRLAWLGDISYASYLLHFPLQLLVAILVVRDVLPGELVRSPLGFIAFFAALIPLSLLIHHGFERPAQRFVRRLGRQRSAPASAPSAP